MQFSEGSSQQLGYSQIRSASGKEWGNPRQDYHSLPHITQPILAKYRRPRVGDPLVIEESSGFWCSLFSMESRERVSLCKCERTEEGHCEMVMRWVEEYYDWQKDRKFVKAYQNYSRRNIEVFLGEKELGSRLDKKLEILGVRLGQRYREMQLRVCTNYLKHTIYYSKADQLTRENDLWMWFVIGIFYHIVPALSQPQPQHQPQHCEEEILFWSVDIIMNHFGSLTREVFHQHISKILELIRRFFPDWHKRLVTYGMDLEPIVYEWTNELMMGYMGIDSIAFFLDCLIKAGWNYFYKVVLSFFEKRMQKMENEELLTPQADRELITAQLINCDEEWPLIFCNANSFCFDKP